MHRRYTPDSLEGLDKNQRASIVAGTGLWSEKRHVASPDTGIQEELFAFGEKIRALCTMYPELIGAGLFGSQVKGYATSESDKDMVIWIDYAEAVKSFDWNNPRPEDIVTKEEIARIRSEMMHGGAVSGNFGQEVKCEVLEQKYRILIHRALGLSGDSRKQIIADILDRDRILNALRSVSSIANTYYIKHAFFLAIGEGIYEYRKLILDELASQGQLGEDKWKSVVHELEDFEDPSGTISETTHSREHLYPQTIAEARKYFLRGAKEANNPDDGKP